MLSQLEPTISRRVIMLSKLWCWLFSCKFKQKVITQITNKKEHHPVTGVEDYIKLYNWERQPYCLRCNCPNPHYKVK
jgi:hypothetical protein